jgi:hypothetical protein
VALAGGVLVSVIDLVGVRFALALIEWSHTLSP